MSARLQARAAVKAAAEFARTHPELDAAPPVAPVAAASPAPVSPPTLERAKSRAPPKSHVSAEAKRWMEALAPQLEVRWAVLSLLST